MNLDDLGVTIAHGVVFFWLSGKWQSVSNEQWAWRYLTVIDEDAGVRWGVWVPRLLLADFWGRDLGSKRLPLPLLSLSSRHMFSRRESAASLVFDFIHNCDFNPEDWELAYDDSFGYTDRELVRTCRLVCRDWARRAPLGDSKLTVTANGAVWHRVEEEWHALPKKYWVWVFREIEWWVERRQQDNIERKCKGDCKAWYPKLIRPIDKSFRPKGKTRSMTSSLSVAKEQYRTDLEPCIGLHFLDNVRDMDNRGLYRTCRLVRREWARRYPFEDPERGKLRVREGVMRYWVEGDWHVLPNTCWAWTFEVAEWWAERCCEHLSRCVQTRCKGWYPKLIRPVDNLTIHNPEYLTLSVRPHGCKQPALTVASGLPPELFKYICNAADSDSWSLRLVCRYWNEQCTARVFEQIDIGDSPERIRALWKFRVNPTFGRHIKILSEIPWYNEGWKFPWIHLLAHFCASTEAVWRSDGSEACIALDGINRRIRSVHYGLPRSVPRSFSRGIQCLALYCMPVHGLEDLTHLACELPDLDKLECYDLTFDSLPAELPRRRPRKSRNKLKYVKFEGETQVAGVCMPQLEIPTFSLFLGAYDAASFFPDEDIAVFLAVLSLAHLFFPSALRCTYDSDEHTRRLQFDLLDDGPCSWAYFRFRALSAHSTTALQVGIDAGHVHGDFDGYLDRWKNLDIMFNRLLSESFGVCTQVVFGFNEREDMVHFAENTLEQLPSISKHFTVQYSVLLEGLNDGTWNEGWYQASLDSEELRGKPKENLLDVYS